MRPRGDMAGAVVLAALLAAWIASCSSIPELTFIEQEGGTEAGPCLPTGREICDDGIDNDCDGRVDCADSACESGFACVDPAPADWSLVAFADDSRPSCPEGFGAGADIRTARGIGDAACACNCGGGCTADVELAFGDAACAGSGSPRDLDVGSGCQRFFGNGFEVSANVSRRLAPPAGSSCAANPSSAPTPVENGRVCAAPARVGGGCAGAQVCAPRSRGGYEICVARQGASGCPAGFPEGHRAGTNANDARACSGCTCTRSACTADVKLYDSVGCNGAPSLEASAASCTPGTNPAFRARAYTMTVAGGCVVATPPTASGSLDLTDERTICCK
ncbi:MAG: hypothetical protein KF819_06635 [Labilithrix sp.]|nr:hypothetical protein [Labilithrix sp.]